MFIGHAVVGDDVTCRRSSLAVVRENSHISQVSMNVHPPALTTPASKIQQQEQGSTSRRRSTNAATTHSCRPLQLCNPRQKFVVVVVTFDCGLPLGKSACRWGQDEHRHHHWLQGKVLPQQPRVQHRHRVDSRTMVLTVAVPGVGTGTSSADGVGMSAAAGQLGSLCSLSPVVPALA